jgi:hypothetical protein
VPDFRRMFLKLKYTDLTKNWKIAALNRKGWKKLLKEAEAHPGL